MAKRSDVLSTNSNLLKIRKSDVCIEQVFNKETRMSTMEQEIDQQGPAAHNILELISTVKTLSSTYRKSNSRDALSEVRDAIQLKSIVGESVGSHDDLAGSLA